MTASFLIRSRFELLVERYRQVFLSIPALAADAGPLRSKDLLAAGPVASEGKFTLEAHLESLRTRSTLADDRPLLIFGLRNNLVNQRAIVITAGRIHAVEGESPEESARPYYGIGLRGGRLVADTALGGMSSAADWNLFFSGIPVLWDDLEGSTLLDLILTEAADHSHVFDLPRGNHPQATAQSRGTWEQLHNVFESHLATDHQRAAQAMRQIVSNASPPLARCNTYLHAILGVDGRGSLVSVIGHGSLEALGRIAADHGCRRAICVENSGSIMPSLVKVWPDRERREIVPLLRAPNFRPLGRALLALELEDDSFDVLSAPSSQSEDVGGKYLSCAAAPSRP